MEKSNLDFKEMSEQEAEKKYSDAWYSSLKSQGFSNITKSDSLTNTQNLITNNCKLLKIINDQDELGYIGFFIKETYGINCCFLEFIFIHPQYRNQGFGSETLDYLEKFCKENNVDEIRSWVYTGNINSNKLFEKLTFNKRYIEFYKKI